MHGIPLRMAMSMTLKLLPMLSCANIMTTLLGSRNSVLAISLFALSRTPALVARSLLLERKAAEAEVTGLRAQLREAQVWQEKTQIERPDPRVSALTPVPVTSTEIERKMKKPVAPKKPPVEKKPPKPPVEKKPPKLLTKKKPPALQKVVMCMNV